MVNESKNERDLLINGQHYTFQSALSGRGQSGMAGFYNSEGKTYLIKEDNPGTCLAESLAINYHPHPNNNPVPIIQANVALVEKNGQKISVSIQEKCVAKENETLMPLDQLIFGRKRNPKTVFSEEYKRSGAVREQIKALSDPIKIELANAIYLSQLNGDESLHTGQFMVTVKTGTRDVTSITRIDFGALGRYAMARDEFDPLHTSKQYAQSGQFGKDYVSYLLQDNTVKDHLLQLWAETKTADVINLVANRFSHQVSNLVDTPSIKIAALNELQTSLAKKSSAPSQSFENVLNNLLDSTEKRCEGMKNKALAYASTQQDKKDAFITISKSYKADFRETISGLRKEAESTEATIAKSPATKTAQ